MKGIFSRGKNLAVIAGLVLTFGGGNHLLASDWTGIYALVDKVVLEPNEQSPERIQVWGVFILSKGESGGSYEAPMRGYMYFSLPKEKVELAKTEWADLKKIAGTGQCVGFGSRSEPERQRRKVRRKQDKPELPDIFPLGIGLTKLPDDHYQVRPLKSVPAPRP